MAGGAIVVHGLAGCDKTRAALAALRDRGAVLADIRADPPPRAVLAGWLERLGPGLLNRASATWRALDPAARDADPLDLLVRHPVLMKRPVIAGGDRLTLGWTPAVRAAWGL